MIELTFVCPAEVNITCFECLRTWLRYSRIQMHACMHTYVDFLGHRVTAKTHLASAYGLCFWPLLLVSAFGVKDKGAHSYALSHCVHRNNAMHMHTKLDVIFYRASRKRGTSYNSRCTSICTRWHSLSAGTSLMNNRYSFI